jgi:hypothetical protein
MRNSSRGKHSFIQFYFDDWQAGTARMTPAQKALYFEICLYSWDRVRPVPKGELRLIISGWPGGGQIVDELVDSERLVRGADGSVYSPRALREGQRAMAAWEAKSRGGRLRQGGEDSSKSGAAELEHSCKTAGADPDTDSEPDSELKGDDVEISEIDPQISPKAIERANAIMSIVEAWNAMAAANGLSQVARVTEKRQNHLNARLNEVGVDDLLTGIQQIPSSRFLTGHGPEGWKANFDWFLQPSSFVKLQEGFYHNRGRGKGSAWTQD